MNKFLAIAVILSVSGFASAQLVLNENFDNWSYSQGVTTESIDVASAYIYNGDNPATFTETLTSIDRDLTGRGVAMASGWSANNNGTTVTELAGSRLPGSINLGTQSPDPIVFVATDGRTTVDATGTPTGNPAGDLSYTTNIGVAGTIGGLGAYLAGGQVGSSGLFASGQDSALGVYATSGGETEELKWDGANDTGRTVGYWKLEYDTEITGSRFQTTSDRRFKWNAVSLNGSAIAGTDSQEFRLPSSSPDEADRINTTGWEDVAGGRYLDPTLEGNYQNDITGVITNPLLDGEAINLVWRRTQGNAFRNVLGAIDNVQLMAVAPGDLDASGDVTTLEAFSTINNIGLSGTDYTGGDGDGDGTVETLEAFTAANFIGSYAATTIPDASAAAVALVYDPSDGSVTLSTDGTEIKSLYLENLTMDSTKAAIPAGALELTNDGSVLSWASLSANVAGDGAVIGEAGFLALGLTEADFTEAGALYGVVGQTGNIELPVVVVPEPATMSLLAIGGLVALKRRRK